LPFSKLDSTQARLFFMISWEQFVHDSKLFSGRSKGYSPLAWVVIIAFGVVGGLLFLAFAQLD